MSNFSTLFGLGGLAGDVLIAGSVRATSVAVAALNIDCSQGNYFTKTVSANSAFTFSNPPPAGTVYVLRLDITHTGGAISFPATVKRVGSAPSLTVNRRHRFFFTTSDGGASWDEAAHPNYPL